MLRLYVTQFVCVVNRTACRSTLAGASSLVDSANAMLGDFDTSEQCEEQLAANFTATHNFIEEMDLSMIN